MSLKLYPYQVKIVQQLLDNPRFALHADMGSGKTICVLRTISELMHRGVLTGKILIIAPSRVADTVWPEEREKWQVKYIRMRVIRGTPDQRLSIMEEKGVNTHVISHETIPWFIKQFMNPDTDTIADWPYQMVVVDESSRLRGFRTRQGALRPRMLAKIATKTPRWINMTGTPAPNGTQDLWGQFWFLDGGKRLLPSFSQFTDRWFLPGRNPYVVVPKPNALLEVLEATADIRTTIRVSDHISVDKPTINKLCIDLPSDAMTAHRRMYEKLYAVLASGELITAPNAAAKVNKCMQIANGFYYGDGDENAGIVHDAKLNALDEILEEACGNPVIVVYHFQEDARRIFNKKSIQARGVRYLGHSRTTLQEWNNGEIPVLLFPHSASAATGINLQHGGNRMVFYSMNYSFEAHDQVIERIGPRRQKNSGYDRPVYLHYIIARGTIDEKIFQSLRYKRDIHDLVMQSPCL